MKKSTRFFATAVAAVALFFTTNASAQKLGIGSILEFQLRMLIALQLELMPDFNLMFQNKYPFL
ncbi:hypothetical protein [Pedobacter steynii]